MLRNNRANKRPSIWFVLVTMIAAAAVAFVGLFLFFGMGILGYSSVAAWLIQALYWSFWALLVLAALWETVLMKLNLPRWRLSLPSLPSWHARQRRPSYRSTPQINLLPTSARTPQRPTLVTVATAIGLVAGLIGIAQLVPADGWVFGGVIDQLVLWALFIGGFIVVMKVPGWKEDRARARRQELEDVFADAFDPPSTPPATPVPPMAPGPVAPPSPQTPPVARPLASPLPAAPPLAPPAVAPMPPPAPTQAATPPDGPEEVSSRPQTPKRNPAVEVLRQIGKGYSVADKGLADAEKFLGRWKKKVLKWLMLDKLFRL